MGQAPARKQSAPNVADAVEAFFADRDLATNTRRAYSHTLDALVEAFGSSADISALAPARLRRFLEQRWKESAPTTWNARITALQSFTGYCSRQGWVTGDPTGVLERRREPRHETRAVAYEDLTTLWSRLDVALREKLFWHMLYETAARANEILSLDIEDLDQGRKRTTVTGKGGHRETVVWTSGTARLLPRYLGGRRRGPLFVTHRLPNVVPADVDRCPDTGLARLSYQRAWELFHELSGGWTLHQLRHSALTHLGESGTSTLLLQAKSRHQDPRTLARYAKPGVEAVARLTAEHDPNRRRR